MPVQYQDLIAVVATICEERKLVASVKESLKGGLITGVCSALGGLILGKTGLLLGAAIGGGIAAINANDHDLKPVAQIIRNMPVKRKEELYERIRHAFRDFGVADVATLGSLIITQQSLKDIAIREVTRYLSSEMSLSVVSAV